MLTVEYSQLGLKIPGGRETEITYLISIKEDGTVSYCFQEFDAGEEYLDFYIGLCGNDGCVNILNGSSEMIDFVEVYDAAGQLVKRVEVGSTDNVMVPVGRKHGVYVVTIGLAWKAVTYKVIL